MRVYINKYGCLEEKDFEFPPGLTIVTGENGSGKSTLLESFLWAFYGDSRTRMSEASVEAEWDNVPVNRITQDGKTSFHVTIDGAGTFSGVREGANVLAESGLPSLRLLLATVWSKQGEVGFIGLTALERRKFLGEVLELGKWEAIRKMVKERLSSVNLELAKLQGRLESSEKERERKENLVAQLEPLAALAKETPEPKLPNSVDSLAVDRLRKELAEIESQAIELDNLRASMPDAVPEHVKNQWQTQLQEADKGLRDTYSKESLAKELAKQIQGIQRSREILESIPCKDTDFPKTCRFVSDAVASVQDVDYIFAKAKELEGEIRKDTEFWEGKKREAQSELETISSVESKRQITTLKIQNIEAAQKKAPGIRKEVGRLEALMLEDSPELRQKHKEWRESHNYLIRIESALGDINNLRQSEESYRKQVDNLKEAQHYLTYMEKDFSPKGVPGYLVEGALPQLADTANAYLSEFSDGYSVRFSMVKDKVSGGQSETLDILVSKGGQEVTIEACSGGERVMVDIALRLALKDFVTARGVHLPNLLVLDETLAPLDEGNRVRFMQTLLSLTGVERIVMISHVPDVRELPGNVISL